MEANELRQMEMLLKEGGIADDGTTVDPVSGNEVPPGSLAKEVRDDVPAQLSEGEYVVPADVVRFFGVRFFEDLRSEAKSGLSGMEADGRIGGEPVPMEGSGDALTPEEMAVLQEMGMNVGGMVAQPDMSKGYADGGQVDQTIDPYTAAFTTETASRFQPGFLIDQARNTAMAPQPKNLVLYGPGGEMVSLIMPQDQLRYDALLKEGYTETPGIVEDPTAIVKQQSDRDSRGPQVNPVGVNPDGTAKGLDFSVDTIAPEDLPKAADRLNMLGMAAKVFGGSLGVPAMLALNTGVAARYNDILDRMDAEGIEHDYKRKGSIFGGEGSLYEGLGDTSGDGTVNFGDTFLGDLLGFDGSIGIEEGRPGLKESLGGARRTATTPTATATSSDRDDSSSSSAGRSSSSSAGRSSSTSRASSPPPARPTTTPTVNIPTPQPKPTYVDRSPVSSGSGASSTSAYRSDGKVSTSGRATGGLVAKRKKKK